jgi:tRNA 2-thiouridine synthesizing protein A
MASIGSSSLADDVLDCRGLKCPLPVLKMEKRLAQMKTGARVVVLADDPIAKIDVPLFCTQNGHVCETRDDGMRFEVVKG